MSVRKWEKSNHWTSSSRVFHEPGFKALYREESELFMTSEWTIQSTWLPERWPLSIHWIHMRYAKKWMSQDNDSHLGAVHLNDPSMQSFQTVHSIANILPGSHRTRVNIVWRLLCDAGISLCSLSCSALKTFTVTRPSTITVVKSAFTIDTGIMGNCYVQWLIQVFPWKAGWPCTGLQKT